MNSLFGYHHHNNHLICKTGKAVSDMDLQWKVVDKYYLQQIIIYSSLIPGQPVVRIWWMKAQVC